MKQFGVANDAQDMEELGLTENEAKDLINFKRLSIHLGLHKESFNYLNKVQSLNRIKNISKLRQLYQSHNVDSPNKNKRTETSDLFRIDEEKLNNSSSAKKMNGRNPVHKSTTGLHAIDEYNSLDTKTPFTNIKTKMRLKSSIGGQRKQ